MNLTATFLTPLALLCLWVGSYAQNEFSIQLIEEENGAFPYHLEVIGLDSQQLSNLKKRAGDQLPWKKIFPVFTGGQLPSEKDFPTILGTYSILEEKIMFLPRFPFSPGLSYFAHFDYKYLNQISLNAPADTGFRDRVELIFSLPEESINSTTYVEDIFPSGGQFPQNLLKLYIYFSEPMRTGEAFEHIKLYDESMQLVKAPFLTMEQELWDRERKRLTIWFDPGRIKRELRPNLELGAPLMEGQRYTLIIDKTWSDEKKQPLKESFVKSFLVGQADRRSPDPSNWEILTPEANTRDKLEIRFPESLDHALLFRMIYIVGSSGELLEGVIGLSREEKSWSFEPASKWEKGVFQIVVDTKLEDLAGNNLQRLFDEDVLQSDNSAYKNQNQVTLPFEIR